jgi:hypothetical protein
MNHTLRRLLLISSTLATVALPVSAVAAPAGDNGARGKEVVHAGDASLPDVLERVRIAASGNEWLNGDWSDPVIEGWVRNVITTVKQAGQAKDLCEPFKFADCKLRGPVEDPRAGMLGQPGVSSLVVTKRLRATRMSNTVALVDGDAEVPYADYCVIIARGAVDIAHGKGNVVIAGHLVNVSHDGSEREMAMRMAQVGGPAPPRPVPPASLLVSGDTLRVSHASGSVLAAAGQLECSRATGCVLLNSPRMDVGGNDGSVELKSDKVRLGEPPAAHAITADLKLKRAARDLAVFWYKDRRYVAERDEPITDEAGAPVQALAGWTISLIGDDFAVLSNEADRATVVMRQARR